MLIVNLYFHVAMLQPLLLNVIALSSSCHLPEIGAQEDSVLLRAGFYLQARGFRYGKLSTYLRFLPEEI